ncbi:MAG TPA: hypothetical protein VHZ27_05295 [Solirubrobacteraceae bacterium]|nr:hypothetical protein [Solirubrobacteraceae bacterium]
MSTQSRQPVPDERRLDLLERSELLDTLGAALDEATAGRGRMLRTHPQKESTPTHIYKPSS